LAEIHRGQLLPLRGELRLRTSRRRPHEHERENDCASAKHGLLLLTAGHSIPFVRPRATTHAYDAVGNLTGKTDRKGQSIAYTYDQLYRLAQKSYPDLTSVTYSYDNASRLTQAADPTGKYQFAYDNMGRLTGNISIQ
jgi:YD repeat-containing protein